MAASFLTQGVLYTLSKTTFRRNAKHFKLLQNVAVAAAGLYSFEQPRTTNAGREKYFEDAFPMNVATLVRDLGSHLAPYFHGSTLLRRNFNPKVDSEEDEEGTDDLSEEMKLAAAHKDKYGGSLLKTTYQRLQRWVVNEFAEAWTRCAA